MATLGFPANPQVGDTYSVGARTWIWTGQGWKIDSTQSSPSFNSLSVGQLFVTTTTNSISTTTGGVVINGGAGIRRDLWVGGTIYSQNSEVVTTATIANLSGNLQSVTGRGNSTTNAIVITNATESTTATDGALVVTGGVGIGGNLNVAGDITARKLTIEYTTVTTTIVETDDIIVTLNTTNAYSTQSGALQVAGGVGIQRDLHVGGTVYTPSISATDESIFGGVVRITNATSATSSSTGALRVSGGASIVGDLYVGGIYSNGQQVLVSPCGSPSFVSRIRAGADISVNTESGIVTIADISTLQSVTSRGNSTTNAVIVNNYRVSTSTDTGAFVVRGGVGIGACVNVGGKLTVDNFQINGLPNTTATINNNLAVRNIQIFGGVNSFGTGSGSLQVLGGMGVDGNIYSSGNVYANGYLVNTGTFSGGTLSAKTTITSTETSTSTQSGALVVVGGVGIGGNIIVGSSVTADNFIATGPNTSTFAGPVSFDNAVKITTNTGSTSTDSGSLLVGGGVGIGGGLNVGGIVSAPEFRGYFNGTILATGTVTTASCATNIIGGLPGNILYQTDAGHTGFVSTATEGQILVSGGAGSPVYQNTLTLTGSTVSASTDTGALVVTGGVGIGGDLNVGGKISGSSINLTSISSVSTITGTLNVGIASVTFPLAAHSTDSGAFTVVGGVGVGGDVYIGGTLFVDRALAITTSTINNAAVTSIVAGTDTAVSTSTGAVVIWNTSTLQTITDRGNSTTNVILISNSEVSTSTTTGALSVAGGVGVGGDVYIGGSLNVTGAIVGGALVVTTATIATQAATSITAGTDTAVSTSTGAITIWNTSTFQTVTDRGNSTTNVILFNNTTISTSTDTGAVLVVGGVGVGGKLNVGQGFKVQGSSEIVGGNGLGYTLRVRGGTGAQYAFGTGQFGINTDALNSTGSAYRSYWFNASDFRFSIFSSNEPGNIVQNQALAISTAGFVTISSLENAVSTQSGALQVVGGVGIGGDLYVGGQIVAQKLTIEYTTVTTTIVETDDIIITFNSTNSTSTNSGALQVAGGVGVGLDIFAGGDIYTRGQKVVTTATINQYANQTSILAGTDTAISTSTGNITIWNTSNLQSVTNRGNSTTNAININSTIDSGSTISGALTVVGGAGIGGTVWIGGNLNVNGTAYLNNAQVLTTQSGLSSILGTSVINQRLLIASGSNSTSTNTGALIVEGGVGIGKDMYIGGIITSINTTNSTSTTSGALILAGGVGVAQDMYVGGTIYSAGSQVLTFANTASLVSSSAGFASTSGFALSFNTGTLVNIAVSATTSSFATTSGYALNFNTGTLVNIAVYASSSTYAMVARVANSLGTGTYSISNTTNSTSTDSGALTVTGGVGIGGTVNVGERIFINGAEVLTTSSVNQFANQTAIFAGTDTAVSSNSGTSITIWNTSTLQTVSNRGNSTTNAILITNITDSAGTNSGALQVVGGAGIGGNLYVGGDLYQRGAKVVTTSTVQSLSTSTLAGVTQYGATTPDAIRITNTSSSTSIVTGALVVAGGVGIGGNINIAGGLVASGINLLNQNQHIWYVDPVIGVNDYTKNGHPSAPARTIKYILGYADDGDTVFIQPGTYYEEFPLTIAKGVNVRGAGLREVIIYPTTATNTATAFLFMGEALISDFTVGGFFKPGYAFEFAPGAVTTTKSPYIERFSVITKGSITSASDPYGFDAHDAGGGAKIDGARVVTTSAQASMMFNEATFIVPNSTGLYMTNGARAEVINTFFYFADKAIHAVSGTIGYGGAGKTKLKLGGISGTLSVGDTLFYKTSGGTTLASGTIASVNGSYVYINGAAWGFDTVSTRTAKIVSALGDVSIDTSVKKYGTGSAKFDGVGDALSIASHADFAFGTGDWTVEMWAYRSVTGAVHTLFDYHPISGVNFQIGFAGPGQVRFIAGNTTRITGTAVSLNTWTHIAVSKSSNVTRLFINGTVQATTYADTNNYGQAAVYIGANYTSTEGLTGYIDDIRVSKGIAKYLTTFTAPTQELVVDEYTVLMLHANGISGSTVFTDEPGRLQVIYSTGTTYASATSIDLADYHQFGAEVRSLGSAAIFGNSGVTADGTGTDIKLIAFNVSHIGAGKDSSDDTSLVVQADEVIQINGGKVYYQTVDQGGDFRVGESFLVNQRTGDVSFGNAQVNLGNLGQLTVTDGSNNAVILPTSVSVGSLVLSGGSLVTHSGNLTLDPAGALTTINSDLQVNGTASISGITDISNQSESTSTNTGALVVTGGVGIGGSLYIGQPSYIGGAQILTTATLISSGGGITTVNAGTDTAVYSYNGIVTVWNTSTLETVTGRGNSTTNKILIINATAAGSTNSGALQVSGGAGIGGDLYIGGSLYQNGKQILSTATINQFANQTSITAGTDTAVSTSTGNIVIWNTGTLQTITGRGATTTNAISITNATPATSTATGALQVSGGVGIGGNLYVGGEIVAQKLTIQLTTVTTTQVTTDDIISTYNITNATSTNSGALQVAGGAGIGGNVYIGGNVSVFGTINASITGIITTATNLANGLPGQLIYQSDVGFTNFVNTGAVGTVLVSQGSAAPQYQNTLRLDGITASTSTNSGALVVAGGVGIGGSLYVTNLSYIAGAQIVTTATINQFANQTSITAGTDTAISTSTGNIVIWNTSTLQSITNRGATTTNVVSFTNTTTSTSTATGAVVITGGLGVGGQINATSIVAGGVRSTTSSSPPANPFVGDLWYNTTNDRLYRYTANGVVNFWLDYTGPVVQYLTSF
jgi:hypothetical protein